jgi:small subunit ribosomal protein S17
MTQPQDPALNEGAEATAERGTRRTLTGVVVSTKMAKTITVQVERTFKHTKYGKYVRRRKRYHAHVETPVSLGDEVEIVASRPLSASKRWRFVRVVKAGADRGVEVSAIDADKNGGNS